MAIRALSFMLRLCGVLAVILGLLYWFGIAGGLLPLHILFGSLAVFALWVIGVDQALMHGNRRVAITAFIIGGLVLVIGITQRSILPGPLHWVVQWGHFLLGLLALAIGGRAVGESKTVR